MNKKRWLLRWVVGVILPVPIGIFLLGVSLNLFGDSGWSRSITELLAKSIGGSLFGYGVFGPHSVIYSTIMNFIVLKHVREAHYVLTISVGLGAFAGSWPLGSMTFVLIGAIVGLLVGVILLSMRNISIKRGVGFPAL